MRRLKGATLLLVSLALHACVVAGLPLSERTASDSPPEIRLKLQPPQPEPLPEPEPPPQPEVEHPPAAEPPPVPAQQKPAQQPERPLETPSTPQPQSEPAPLVPEQSASPVETGESKPAPPPAPVPLPEGPGDKSGPDPAPEPAPLPAPEPGPTVDLKALLASYAAEVKTAILRQRVYPAVAQRLGHQGSVKVSFSLSGAGSLTGLEVSAGSGYDSLDDAALAAVRNAAPFAALPAELDRDSLSLSITLNYSLD